MSVTRSGPLTSGGSSSPSLTSSHQRGAAPRRWALSLATASPMAATSSSVYGPDLDLVVLLALGRLLPLGPDHQAVLPREDRTRGGGEHLRQPFVDGATGEVTDLVVYSDQCVAASHPHAGAQRVPPLPERSRVEGMDASERVALHQGLRVAFESRDLVLSDERVPSDQVRGGDGAVPTSGGAVGGVAPEGVVVAIGLGDVPKGVLVGDPVMRWVRVGTRDPDALPEPGHPLVGDGVRHAEAAVSAPTQGVHGLATFQSRCNVSTFPNRELPDVLRMPRVIRAPSPSLSLKSLSIRY